jgi:hypothetical protein
MLKLILKIPKNKSLEITLFLKRVIFTGLLLTAFSAWCLPNQSQKNHQAPILSIQYLLAVDRLDFYKTQLQDFLEGKKDPELIAALKKLTPEVFYDLNLSLEQLSDSKLWQQFIFTALKKQNPQLKFKEEDLFWNYSFLRNKLNERFLFRSSKLALENSPEDSALENLNININIQDENSNLSELNTQFHLRSVPKIQGSEYLIDVERYVSEKTTRAFIWDALMNNRDLVLMIGNQNYFKNYLAAHSIELVGEVLPLARNYNKIYLTWDPRSQKYSYIINRISGEDRIQHLLAQLRLIQFQNQTLLTHRNQTSTSAHSLGQNQSVDKIKVIGSAKDFHKQQEMILTDLFKRLPKADKVIIGQKGAFENDLLKKILSQSQNRDSIKGFKQFNSEQSSHHFSDVLLQNSEGTPQRWRFISSVWGDEIIPIARALKNSGNLDLVYIGTAGALENKGLQIGDVVPAHFVKTHSGKTLDFSAPQIMNFDKSPERKFTVGQVHTPFEETNSWLQKVKSEIDLVEVETGYLREEFGVRSLQSHLAKVDSLSPSTHLEAYFLISDIVGSEKDNLAKASQNSSKRKKGQQRLIQNLFLHNDIKTSLSHFYPITTSSQFKNIYLQLQKLRPSREPYSLFQVAQIANQQNKTSVADLELLLQKEPVFSRLKFNAKLDELNYFLMKLQKRLPSQKFIYLHSEKLFDGTFNPQSKSRIPVGLAVDKMKPEFLKNLITPEELQTLNSFWQLDFYELDKMPSYHTKESLYSGPQDLFNLLENLVYKNFEHTFEIDDHGNSRLKPLPGLNSALRCESVFRLK